MYNNTTWKSKNNINPTEHHKVMLMPMPARARYLHSEMLSQNKGKSTIQNNDTLTNVKSQRVESMLKAQQYLQTEKDAIPASEPGIVMKDNVESSSIRSCSKYLGH